MNTLTAEIRSPNVKVKSLRRSGFVPCCIFGPQLPDSLSIQIDKLSAEKLLRNKGEGCTVNIDLDGKKTAVLIKDVSKNTLKNEIEHIGFQVLDATKKINSKAKIILQNRDKAAGFIGQLLFEIPYTAFPADIIESVTIDMADIPIGSQLTLNDLEISKNENIQLLLDGDSVVLTVADIKRASDTAASEAE